MDSDAPAPGTLGTIRNAIFLLELLSTGPAYQQLTELAERSGFTAPTVHRVLRSLATSGLVTQSSESSRYSLGPEVLRLSQCYLMRLPVVQALAPYLVDLRNTTKATVRVALLARSSVVYVDRIDGEHTAGVYRAPHRVHSALETAAGRILLARAGADTWKEAVHTAAVQGLAPQGSYPDDITFEEQELWALSPYLALNDPQAPGFLEVAVPVTNQRDQTLASLSASDEHESFTAEVVSEQIVPQLLRVASAVRQTVSSA
ncbi:MAG: IclR family transcriptional regulator [Pseudonocardiaceae bacterium]